MALLISAEDRIYLRSQWRLNRRRFAFFLLACLGLHVAIFAFLILRSDQLILVEPEAIPIEIVQEPEPPPQEQQQEEQKPEEEKKEEEKPEEKKEEPPPQQVEEAATDAARPVEKQAEELRREKLAPEPQPQPTPELAQPEAPAEPTPPLEEILKEAPPEPPAPQKPEKTFAEKFGSFQPVPDMEFDAAAPRTPMAGQANNSYNATLFGMIVPLVKIPPRPADGRVYQGKIGFAIDGNGKLISVALMQPSGIKALDESAVAAVRKAAPFPRPPGGQPIQLYFSYAPR